GREHLVQTRQEQPRGVQAIATLGDDERAVFCEMLQKACCPARAGEVLERVLDGRGAAALGPGVYLRASHEARTVFEAEHQRLPHIRGERLQEQVARVWQPVDEGL